MKVVDLFICFDGQNFPNNDSGASLICVTNFQLVEVEQAKKAHFPCMHLFSSQRVEYICICPSCLVESCQHVVRVKIGEVVKAQARITCPNENLMKIVLPNKHGNVYYKSNLYISIKSIYVNAIFISLVFE